jgi:hypothetical protein
MHEPIKNSLESYLRGAEVPAEFSTHLKACDFCATQLQAMQEQSRMLGVLRGGEQEPRAGFYGRVMDRIEGMGRPSIWSALLEPVFATRLIVASAALVLVLGGYLVSTEPISEPGGNGTSTVAVQQGAGSDEDGRLVAEPQERDAVLVNLVAYRQ